MDTDCPSYMQHVTDLTFPARAAWLFAFYSGLTVPAQSGVSEAHPLKEIPAPLFRDTTGMDNVGATSGPPGVAIRGTTY